jgi:hypothetical protein
MSLDIALIFLRREQLQQSDCIRAGWSDSSPIAGYDWIWSQFHEIPRTKVIATFNAVSALTQAIAERVCELSVDEEGDAHQDGEVMDAAWTPWLQTIQANILEHISTPAALGSGHRSLAHKASAEVYKWGLQEPPGQLVAHATSYIAHCSDMGVELGLPDFTIQGQCESLLPSWFHRDVLAPDIEVAGGAGDDPDGLCLGDDSVWAIKLVVGGKRQQDNGCLAVTANAVSLNSGGDGDRNGPMQKKDEEKPEGGDEEGG